MELVKKALGKFWRDGKNAVFFLANPSEDQADGWKFRRALIFGAYRLSVAMIVFGAITFFFDTNVSNNLITGGVAMISIIISAYVAGATFEDSKKKGQ